MATVDAAIPQSPPASMPGAPASAAVQDKGLKRNAIGYLSNLVIGVASTAPAYSLATTLGGIVLVAGMGVHAPAVLLVSFVPMLLIAAAYKYLNRADPDAGTTFAWTTRALGPATGWVNGWAIFLADVIVMASLAQIAATYTFKLFSWESAASSKAAVLIVAVLWIAVMTWICYRGIELSARVQQFLLGAEIAILALFSVVALAKVYGGHPSGSITPELSWFDPFAMKFSALVDGVLLGVFIYWGWDSGVAVNEESEDANEGPGRAAVMSTILLVLIYVVVTAAAQSFHGTKFLGENESDVLSALGKPVLGGVFYKLLIIAVLTSASASTQTTILPTARTTLSMACWKSIPGVFSTIHKRYLTPTWSTLGMGAISIAITVPLLLVSEHVLVDSIVAIGFPICCYYGFTGIACAVYYRHELLNSARDFVLLGLAPLLGGLMLFGVGVYAGTYYNDPSNLEGETHALLGLTLPIWMGVGGLALGVVLMLVSRGFFREFFARRTETAPAGLIDQPVEHAPAHLLGPEHVTHGVHLLAPEAEEMEEMEEMEPGPGRPRESDETEPGPGRPRESDETAPTPGLPGESDESYETERPPDAGAG